MYIPPNILPPSFSEVWPDQVDVDGNSTYAVKILLCLWHVRKAWLENAIQKIKANYLRTLVLQDCADLMYGNKLLEGEAAV